MERNKLIALSLVGALTLLIIGFAIGSYIPSKTTAEGFRITGSEARELRGILAEEEGGKEISVTGIARIKTAPDSASVSLGVTTQAATAQEALNANSQTMDKVISAVKALGIPDRDIQTTNVNLFPVYDFGKPQDTRQPQIVGYRAENTISVEVAALGKTGEIIDAANKAGVNVIQGLSFKLSQEKEDQLKRTLLKSAVEDARERAQAITEPLGIKEITPLRITEGYSVPPPIFLSSAALKEAQATPISPGEMEVSATVSIVFGFE